MAKTNNIDFLMCEKERVLKRIKEIERTLEEMPKDTVLGILCMKAYLKKAKRDLEKIQREITEIS